MRERSRARAWSLRILYAWEARGRGDSPVTVLEEFLAERTVAGPSRGYLRRLIELVAEHGPSIDDALQAALLNWRLERLSAIDRNILRIAAAEMLHVPDVPRRVSIQEAIRLAEKYGTAESPRFVNGVLDALLHQLEGRADDRSGAGGVS